MSEQRGVVVFADSMVDPERSQAEAAAAQLDVALRIAMNEEDLAKLLPEATVLITQRTPIGGDLVSAAPRLRQLQVLEYGFHHRSTATRPPSAESRWWTCRLSACWG